MNIKYIKKPNEVNDLFMQNIQFKDSNVFHSQYYFNVLAQGTDITPVVLVAEENNLVLGFILIQIQNILRNRFKKTASRAVITGGPVFNGKDEVLSFLLLNYNHIFGNKILYTQIRNIFDMNMYDEIFERNSFKRIDHLNYIIDLNKKIDDIWNGVYSKRKNEIRKGKKEGLTVTEINYDSDLQKAYDILKGIYKKAKLPLPQYDYFKNALEVQNSDKILRIMGGYSGGNLVGVMLLLCFNDRVYNWYAASNPEYYKIYPNDVITWEAIKWASENGYKLFDFGGAGNPAKEYGVRDFKKKFGGAEVNFGRYECVHKPLLLSLAKRGFKLWQKLN